MKPAEAEADVAQSESERGGGNLYQHQLVMRGLSALE